MAPHGTRRFEVKPGQTEEGIPRQVSDFVSRELAFMTEV